jgi:CheY-like chemotaxis protein
MPAGFVAYFRDDHLCSVASGRQERWDTQHRVALLPVLIMMSTAVLDRQIVVFFTSATLLAAAGTLGIRYFVLHAQRYTKNDLDDFLVYAVTCAFAALVGRLLVSRIEGGFRLLRKSENGFRNIFENTQDVNCEMRNDGTKMLRKHDFAVFETENGSAAIGCIGGSRRNIDVILLDLTLPGASADAIVTKAAQVRPEAKVILASAYSEEKAGAIMSLPQIRGFIRKPFSFAVLSS